MTTWIMLWLITGPVNSYYELPLEGCVLISIALQVVYGLLLSADIYHSMTDPSTYN